MSNGRHEASGALASSGLIDGVLGGGGDMGHRMRTTAWTDTPLGPVDGWPQSLRSALSICLGSGFPIAIYWGPALALLYNDAWSPIPGSKHPWALGREAREVWPEIWDTIGPMFEQVMTKGEATYSEDGLLPMHRHGYVEECYFNFTFTPIRGEGGRVEGVFNAVIETTFRVISERRAQLLRGLSTSIAGAESADEACARAAATLGGGARDVPFCALYLCDQDGAARLAGLSGVQAGSPGFPRSIDVTAAGSLWPLAEARASRRVQVQADLAERFGVAFPGGAWPEAADSALVAPMIVGDKVGGFLVLGANPRRAIDDEYRGFAERAASLVAAVVASANALEVEIKRAEALAELNRAKTDFFSNVSHEFRTPLTLMIGPTEDALASEAGTLGGAALDTVYRNELRLLRLVNGLLDFSRIEAGRVQPNFQATDLSKLTTELAGMFESTIARAGLKLVLRCEPLSTPVFVDREMWEKIVLNLLSNAFKFTFEGEIEVALRAERDEVVVSVRDTGIGIASEELPRLFERFHRVEGARTRSHEGSGIGLALVHDLVRTHGGVIGAESAPGHGTTFTIKLPLGSKHLPGDRIRATTDAAGTPRRSAAYIEEASRWLPEAPPSIVATVAGAPRDDSKRIVVADDNADMRDYIVGLLSPRWTVVAVPDGEAALAAAKAGGVDLVLTDVMMPRLDGFGLLAALKADAATSAIPVIILSARSGDESRVVGLGAGADDYLVKPFSARELVARVGTQLRLAQVRAELVTAKDRAEAATRTKDEFLAMLGHELRNPLSPIHNAVQLLRLRGVSGRELSIIERQVSHLVRLVDDLLDVSRVTRGKLELRKELVEVSAFVLRGVELASPIIVERRQRLDLEVPVRGLVVDGDADRLAQVVSNLLTNASKYSDPEASIRIIAERVGAKVRLRVLDRGIGLAPEMVAAIFDSFVQQPQALDRSRGGLGLGLTIVRSLVQLHGGTVEARSEGTGRGSEFVVELPLALGLVDAPPSRDGASATAPPPAARKARARKRILVVDDNEDAASTLAEFLEDLGCEVQVAHDGPSGLERARTFRPDIGLLDIGLPLMDGYALARAIRGLAEMPEGLRLVAITGYGQDSDRSRSLASGFDNHIVKPLDLAFVTRLVEGNGPT
ncbi:MAG TPA: ATP-binding protein [Polyangia bacterium]|nr:ATP-binding protein [Polyangia bacterium]